MIRAKIDNFSLINLQITHIQDIDDGVKIETFYEFFYIVAYDV